MKPLKQLEHALKRLATWVLALLLSRPWRRAAADAALRRCRRVLLVRLDDRVGEAVLMTPLLASLARRVPRPEVHLFVHPRSARVLAHAAGLAGLHVGEVRRPLAPAFLRTLLRLRRERFDVVVDCGNWTAPSLANALVTRVVGAKAARLGPGRAPSRALQTHTVPAREDTRRESLQRLHLLAPLGLFPLDEIRLAPPPPTERLSALFARLGEVPLATLYPGGRLAERRVPEEAFVAAGKVLLRRGRVPVVAWGPGEEDIARRIVEALPGAVLAPPTTLDELAALLARGGLTVCNNTGPMHLSVAVGAATLQLFRGMDPERWGHPAPPHAVLDVTALAGDPERLREDVCLATERFLGVRPKVAAR